MLLVELTPDDPLRRFRTNAYPFLMGLARLLGAQASWCALGVRFQPTLRYRLEPADLKLLLCELRRCRSDVVIINERLDDDQWARLGAACRGGHLAYCSLGETFPNLGAFVRTALPAADPAVLEDPRLLDRIEPDFRRRVLNQAPWAADPVMRLSDGVPCAYRRPLAQNPFYRGLSLPPGAMGCAFCGTMMVHERMPVADPLAFLLKQVRAACRLPAGKERLFEVQGSGVWTRLDSFLAELLRLGLRRAQFCFAPRVDELLAARRVLERRLPALARRELSLRFYTMGVENFSAAENQRLNKGLTARQVHEAVDFVCAMTARWPRAFRFSKGDMSMILFTPWTTLADLRINIRHIRRCAWIDPPAALGKRLQLFKGRPITLLAQRDGLVVKKGDDHFYNSGCMPGFDQGEVPWRFARPEVAVLYRFARRISADGGIPSDDAESRAITEFLISRDHHTPQLLALFEEAVKALERRPRTDSVAGLLKLLRSTPLPARAGLIV
jgi:hypothetical protein